MEQFTKDMNIIAKLDNEPNDMGGLTAEQLKAKFDEGGLALQKYINEVILPRMGEPWQGDLLMNGYRITGLGAPVNETDALRKMDAAPAGYGLGETSSPSVSDLNACVVTGWYRTSTTTANVPAGFEYSSVSVQSRLSGHIIQSLTTILNNGIGTGIQMIRRSTDSGATWTEEWVNPPMTLGVEYRTTERHKGKVVYTKLVNLGTLPAVSGRIAVNHEANATAVIRVSGVSSGGYAIPYGHSAGTGTLIDIAASPTQIIVWTGENEYADYSDKTGTAQIWYIKD